MEILAYPRDGFPDRKILVQRIADFLEPDYRPSHALLDSKDYSQDSSVSKNFHSYAFQWDRSRPKDRVPAHVLDLMNDDQYSQLVWVSRKMLEEEEILFVFMLAHEFRHVYQVRRNLTHDAVRRKSRALWRDPEFHLKLSSLPLDPPELDADIFALRTTRSIFGPEPMTQLIGRRNFPRCPDKLYAPFLLRLEEIV